MIIKSIVGVYTHYKDYCTYSQQPGSFFLPWHVFWLIEIAGSSQALKADALIHLMKGVHGPCGFTLGCFEENFLAWLGCFLDVYFLFLITKTLKFFGR